MTFAISSSKRKLHHRSRQLVPYTCGNEEMFCEQQAIVVEVNVFKSSIFNYEFFKKKACCFEVCLVSLLK